MTIRHHRLRIPLLLLGLTLSPLVAGEGKTTFDDYVVHHSVIPSTFISASIAGQYDLVRSRSLGLLNVSVHARNEGAPPDAVAARLEGSVINDAQQRESLSFRRIREGESIYYLAQFQYREGRTMTFELQSSPHDSDQTLPLQFTSELYYD